MCSIAPSDALPLPSDPDSNSDYVYEKKYHGFAQLEIKQIADEDVTFISVRCPIGAHYDFQTVTEEELEQLPEVKPCTIPINLDES